MNRIIHFEIHADDMERAAKFYHGVFGWKVGGTDDQPFWAITTGLPSSPGINGALIKRRGPRPAEGAPVNGGVGVVGVASLEETSKKITDRGGAVTVPLVAIPGVGRSAYFRDPEGNVFGIFQADPTVK
jgi:predicted enzyme related to lactoylglutathione lyase